MPINGDFDGAAGPAIVGRLSRARALMVVSMVAVPTEPSD